MIDYIKLILAGVFPSIGSEVKVVRNYGLSRASYTKDRYYIYRSGADFSAQVRNDRKEILLEFCPAKILQGHNGLGSNDLITVVDFAVREIFFALNITIDKDLKRRLKNGNYILKEVHIAELHSFNRNLISAVSDIICRHGAAELNAQKLERGIGVRLWPFSRERQVLIYDKAHYYSDKPTKHHKVLTAGTMGLAKLGLEMEFKRMQKYLRLGVRIEVRLLAPYLKRLKLNTGKTWRDGEDNKAGTKVARHAYLHILSSIPIASLPPVPAAEAMLHQLSGIKKAIVAIWLSGRDPSDNYVSSRATYYRYRKQIKKKFGIDLSRTPLLLLAQPPWELLFSGNVIIPSPQWALSSGFVFDPAYPRYQPRQELRGNALPRDNKAIG